MSALSDNGVMPNEVTKHRPNHLTMKNVNAELAKYGNVRLAKEGDNFYFWSGEAVDWIETAVLVPTLSSLTLDQWIDKFKKLKAKNAEMAKLGA